MCKSLRPNDPLLAGPRCGDGSSAPVHMFGVVPAEFVQGISFGSFLVIAGQKLGGK